MTQLTCYIIRQHIGPFLLGFLLVVFVLLVDVTLQFLDRVLSKGITTSIALQLLLYNMAWIVALAVPMAVLIATLMTFARMASDGELLAAKTCGFSFYKLFKPIFMVSILLAITMIIFNNYVLPDWNHRARSISSSLQRTKASLVLKQREGVFLRGLGSYNLLIRQVNQEKNTLSGITLYDTNKKGPPGVLHADSGELSFYNEGAYARLTLIDCVFHRIDNDLITSVFGHLDRQIVHIKDPRRAFKQRTSSYRSDRELNISAMYTRVDDKYISIEKANRSIDESTENLITSFKKSYENDKIESLSQPELDALQHRIDSTHNAISKNLKLIETYQATIDEFQVEIHKKFSIPIACIVFAILGAPLGAMIRQQGTAVSVGISLTFFWIYWLFLIGGEELADRGLIAPSLAMWSPNIAFLLVGFVLLYNTTNERGLLKSLESRS